MSLRVLNTGYLPPSRGWEMLNQCHRDHSELIIVLSGTMDLISDQGTVTVNRGHVNLYPAGTMHGEISYAEDPVELVYIVFTGCREKAVRTIRDRSARFRHLGRFLQQARMRADAPELEMQYADIILTEFFAVSQDGDDDIAAIIRAYLLERLTVPVSTEEMAQQVHLSQYHFIRKFKELTGNTPQQAFRRLRIEEAANILLTADLPLRVIAPMVGYSNEYHLAREFKKVMGVPPGAYRKSHAP